MTTDNTFIVSCQEAFLSWLDNPANRIYMDGYYTDDDGSKVDVTIEHSPDWLCAALWDCSDLLPAEYCHKLELPKGSTYGFAARKLRPMAFFTAAIFGAPVGPEGSADES